MARGLRVVFFWFSISFALSTVSEAQTGGGSWEALAPLPTARQELATAVLNGKIYVIGGYDENGASTSTVEVYDPAANTWGSAASLPFAINHGSAAVAAGKLYSFGAGGSRVFVYQPSTDSWVEVASMNFQHGGTAAVCTFNEKIYVAGGTQGSSSIGALEVYDPAVNTWTNLSSMTVPRNHTGGAFLNGKFYVVGGRGSAGSSTALEVYDPVANSWTTRAPMPTGRSGIGVAAVNGELWVFGGELPGLRAEVEAYNPLSNTWRSLPPMPSPRHGIWASVIGNRVHFAGGGSEEGFGASNVNDVFAVARKATFANISTRLRVEIGDRVLIAGFIITGNASKRVILRALGPSLPVPGALADPALELYDGSGQLVSMNDNWQDAANQQETIDSTLAPPQIAEAAILTLLAPGNYTAVVRGVNGTAGVALVEAYDLEAGSDAQLANISTRGFVQTGDNVLIGGLILTGNDPRRTIVRAIGPSLPLAGALPDPRLELRDGNGALLVANDNWRSDQEAEIIDTRVPPLSDLEAAAIATLPPGSYTAIVRGAGATTGIALVEGYALD